MLLELLQINEALEELLEAPLDMPEGADMVQQLEILMQRLESTKKALGIANRLTDPAERKKHRSRVMIFMNQLRAAFNKVADKLEAEIEDQEEMERDGVPQAVVNRAY